MSNPTFAQIARYYMRNFPQSYKCTSAVARHLFYVVRNGFSWVSGELVKPELPINECLSETEIMSDLDVLDSCSASPSLDRFDAACKLQSEHERSLRKTVLANVDLLVETGVNIASRFDHPMMGHYYFVPSDISNIMNVPADLNDSWAQSVLDAQQMWLTARVVHLGFAPGSSHPTLLGKINPPWPAPFQSIYESFMLTRTRVPALKRLIDIQTQFTDEILAEIKLEHSETT